MRVVNVKIIKPILKKEEGDTYDFLSIHDLKPPCTEYIEYFGVAQ